MSGWWLVYRTVVIHFSLKVPLMGFEMTALSTYCSFMSLNNFSRVVFETVFYSLMYLSGMTGFHEVI